MLNNTRIRYESILHGHTKFHCKTSAEDKTFDECLTSFMEANNTTKVQKFPKCKDCRQGQKNRQAFADSL